MEQWQQVVGYEGLYAVSDHGRVRRETARTCAVAGHIRAQHIDRDGYPQVTLSKPEAGQRSWKVHKLVWEAFRGAVPRGLTINHKDGDKLNNTLGNLELMTNGDNIRHAISVLGQDRRGARNPAAKLTVEAVVGIREARADGVPVATIAATHGISRRMVGLITSGRAWTSAPGPLTKPRIGRPRGR